MAAAICTAGVAQYGLPRWAVGKTSAEKEETTAQHPAAVSNGVTAVTTSAPPVGRSYSNENGISPRQLCARRSRTPCLANISRSASRSLLATAGHDAT